ncbi:MAG: universal stress protein [Burkholderiaceae bacterium]
MRYPTILLPLDDDADAATRVQHAAVLARRLESHLVGLSCRPRPLTGATIPPGSEPPTPERRQAEEHARAREERFRRRCAAVGASHEVAIVGGDPRCALLERAATADLLVLGQPEVGGGPCCMPVEDVLRRSPRPTLVLPARGRTGEGVTTALVAWDGSRGAARAAADALPLLACARAVHLVHVGRPRAEADAGLARAATWLSRHGIRADVAVADPAGSVGDTLLAHALRLHADLVVMGAWGRPRVVERLLGGTTRAVLEAAAVPVLLSH